MTVYKGEFKDWSDVQEQFQMTEVEPEDVIFAEYDVPGYEGTASVFYRRGNKYYVVEGGHCSCYGLEGQWKPEEYDRESFVRCLKKGIENWIEGSAENRAFTQALKRMGEI